jgi:hypothetical protein
MFGRYAENVKQLPVGQASMVIRSVFPSGGAGRLPQSVSGFYSTSLVQPFSVMLGDLTENKYRTYQDLVTASSR